jgi:hypothetical protein
MVFVFNLDLAVLAQLLSARSGVAPEDMTIAVTDSVLKVTVDDGNLTPDAEDGLKKSFPGLTFDTVEAVVEGVVEP